MSTSDDQSGPTDFADWLVGEYAEGADFTALVVLVEIGETLVTPLCSTYFNVVGDEVGWDEIVLMFEGSGVAWDGAAFFPVRASSGGPLDNPTARIRLRELEARLDDDRLILNEGHFFDKWGRRMRIDEVLQ